MCRPARQVCTSLANACQLEPGVPHLIHKAHVHADHIEVNDAPARGVVLVGHVDVAHGDIRVAELGAVLRDTSTIPDRRGAGVDAWVVGGWPGYG